MKTLKNLTLVLFSLLVFSCSEDSDVLNDENALEIDSKKIEAIKNGLTSEERNTLINLITEFKLTSDQLLIEEINNLFYIAQKRHLNIAKTSADCMIDGLIAWVDTYNSAREDGASQEEANMVAEISERVAVRQCNIAEQ